MADTTCDVALGSTESRPAVSSLSVACSSRRVRTADGSSPARRDGFGESRSIRSDSIAAAILTISSALPGAGRDLVIPWSCARIPPALPARSRARGRSGGRQTSNVPAVVVQSLKEARLYDPRVQFEPGGAAAGIGQALAGGIDHAPQRL